MTEKKQRFISLDEGYDFIIRDTITHTDLCDVDSVIDVLNDYDKENEQLKHDATVLICSNQEYRKENEQLKKALDDFKAYDDEDFREAKYINSIYKEEGFNGVIDYAKDKLQYYGSVKEVEKGLWVLVTGGWSDNEFFIDCLNNLISNFGRLHYRAYERGGAFYYTEEPRADVEISLKKEVKE